jgi:vacuolar-type H+-ATPase subunit I/STV1
MSTHYHNPFSRSIETYSENSRDISQMREELQKLRDRVEALEAISSVDPDYVDEPCGHSPKDSASDPDYLEKDLAAAVGVLLRLDLANNAAEENHGKYLRWARNMTSTTSAVVSEGQCDIPVRRQISAWFLHNAEEVEAKNYSYQSLAQELREIASVSPVEVNWREQKNERLAFAWLDQAWRYVDAKYRDFPF